MAEITSRNIIGIMSGTSLDGIDIALVHVEGSGVDTRYELLEYSSYPYSKDIQEKVIDVSYIETSNVAKISSLHYELGQLYSDAVQGFIKDRNIDVKIDAVGLHGQTIHHLPNEEIKSTLQIGSASHLAFDLKTTVVSNFREMDIVAGGDGAPLVPYTDYIMFGNKEGLMLQNIGGIGNVTVIGKDAAIEDVFAFDTGPGNMMINTASQYFYQKDYDENGDYAKQGKRIDALYKDLCSHDYINKLPPKSTGREMFGEDMTLEYCRQYKENPKDVIYTLTEFTAETIYQSYLLFIKDKIEIDKLVISGGGAYNKMIMSGLRTRFDIPVLRQEDLGYSSDAKEAIAFALLANDTLSHIPNNIAQATGAKCPVILGQITMNPRSYLEESQKKENI